MLQPRKAVRDVIAVLLVFGEDAVFDQERQVANSIYLAGVAAVVVIRRRLKNQLHLVPGNQLDPLGSVIFVPRVSVGMLQPVLIVTHLFFERGVVVALGVIQCGCSLCVLSTRENQWEKYPFCPKAWAEARRKPPLQGPTSTCPCFLQAYGEDTNPKMD